MSDDILIRPPTASDGPAFIDAVRRSQGLHHPWVFPPDDTSKFGRYLERCEGDDHRGFLIQLRDSGELAGAVNVSQIFRGGFCSAYLGFAAFVPHGGHGYVRRGLALVIDEMFDVEHLHRLEANIQPENERSCALVQGLGFTREGYSRRYLKIGGEWKDHVRWAILVEDWRTLRKDR